MCATCNNAAIVPLITWPYGVTLCRCFGNGCYQRRGIDSGCNPNSKANFVWRWARDHRGAYTGRELRLDHTRILARHLANKHRRSLEILKAYGD